MITNMTKINGNDDDDDDDDNRNRKTVIKLWKKNVSKKYNLTVGTKKMPENFYFFF